ncbi:MAG TPA: hypothetical protein DD420_34930 [Streptomyces sp.]|nr:hypothetical protein [Streptomyces sp.]
MDRPGAVQPSSPPRRKQLYWQGYHVPFIAPWSVEKPIHAPMIRTAYRGVPGIGYTDEAPAVDRRQGALWQRWSIGPGKGEAHLAGTHPLRQRQAMTHLLCQVCGNSTFTQEWTDWGEQHLFLMRSPKEGQVIEEGEMTETPPVCLPCALESVQACKHLVRGWTAALVKYVRPWGIAGILHHHATLWPLFEVDKPLSFRPYGHADYPWILAARDMVQLEGVTPVDLRELADAAGLPQPTTGP